MTTLIKRVKIFDFQSHEDTEIEFLKGLNVITGPSDEGKSAIIRAIKWALYNEPKGTEFIRHGASRAKVIVELDNGFSVVRERSKSRNRYEVISPDGEVQVFEGFGNDIPLEVIKATGISKVKLDNDLTSAINVGEQLEGPFLLSETGAVRAKALGRIIGLHFLDKALRDINTDLRRENQTLDRLNREVTEAKEELLEYESLKTIEYCLSKTDKTAKELEILITKLEYLEDIQEKLGKYFKYITETGNMLEKLNAVQEAELEVKKAIETLSRMKILERLSHGFHRINKEIRFEKNIRESVAKVDECYNYVKITSQKVDEYKKLCNLYTRYKNFENSFAKQSIIAEKTKNIPHISVFTERIDAKLKRMNTLSDIKEKLFSLAGKIKEGKEYLAAREKEIAKLSEDYLLLLKKLSKCPFCGSKISELSIEEVLRHYTAKV